MYLDEIAEELVEIRKRLDAIEAQMKAPVRDQRSTVGGTFTLGFSRPGRRVHSNPVLPVGRDGHE